MFSQGESFQAEIVRQMRDKQLAAKRKREIRSSYRYVLSHDFAQPPHGFCISDVHVHFLAGQLISKSCAFVSISLASTTVVLMTKCVGVRV